MQIDLSDRAGWLTGHVLVVDGGALVADPRTIPDVVGRRPVPIPEEVR